MVALLWLFIFPCNFQITDTIPLEKYNSEIYKAEKHIINEEYSFASTLYLNLSASFYLWNGDLQNALTCSLLSENIQAIERFITLLFERGTTIRYLENQYKDFAFFRTALWGKLKKKDYNLTYKTQVQLLTDSMHVLDQKGGRSSIPVSKRLENDFANLITLDKLIEEYGFPTQKELGFDSRKDSIEHNQNFEIVLIHLAKLQPWEFGILLSELYFDNKMCNSKFVYLYSHTKSCDDIQLSCFPFPPTNALFVDNVMFTCNAEEIKRINENRKKYYLDTVKDQL